MKPPAFPDKREPMRIAMWSGPRNISTAMMRSWGSRADTFVCDEPLYAHYLRETGKEHPGRDEVIAQHETDYAKVVPWLTGPVPGERAIFYQKHMAHHILPGDDIDWIDSMQNAFLIREPLEMLTSLAKVIPAPSLEDTGLPQQVRLLSLLSSNGGGPERPVPPILDARDVLEKPWPCLRALCEGLDVLPNTSMLSWDSGPRETDGVWAKYWYHSVERSSEFAQYKPKHEALPAELEPVFEECRALYEQLYEQRIRV